MLRSDPNDETSHICGNFMHLHPAQSKNQQKMVFFDALTSHKTSMASQPCTTPSAMGCSNKNAPRCSCNLRPTKYFDELLVLPASSCSNAPPGMTRICLTRPTWVFKITLRNENKVKQSDMRNKFECKITHVTGTMFWQTLQQNKNKNIELNP